MAIDLTNSLNQSELGELVGVSRQAVGAMVERGVLSASMTTGGALLAYCSHLRETAAGRLASGGLDLAAERAGLAKAQRERIEMQIAVTRRELMPAILLEEVLAKAGSKVSGIFDAIPGMVKRRVPTLPSFTLDLIAAEVARARNIVAAMSLDDVLDRLPSAEDARLDDEKEGAGFDSLPSGEGCA